MRTCCAQEIAALARGKELFDRDQTPRCLIAGFHQHNREHATGGMPTDVFWQAGKLPKDVWVPDQGVAPYRGRG